MSFAKLIAIVLVVSIGICEATTCTAPGSVACPTPVTFSSVSPDLAFYDILGPIPPAWLFPNGNGVCTLNPYAVPPAILDPTAILVEKYTQYCLSFLPCTPCYDAPRRPGSNGESAVAIPRDAVLHKGFSTGWWYFVGQLYSRVPKKGGGNSDRHNDDDDETCPVGPFTNNVDVIMSESYNNPPKSGGFGAFLPAKYKGDFLVQSSSSRVGVRSTTGVTENKFAPNSVTGISPDPWLAKYTAKDLNITFRLLSGKVGIIGAKYEFSGKTATGATVKLIGRDVSGVIEQGDRGFIDVPIPAGSESLLAGTNYFSLRLDITGTVKLLDGKKLEVYGTSDFDFQWANGNPSPRNTASSWTWFNLRLPSKCNLFINQQRQANGAMITGARSSSYSKLNSPTLPSQGPGLPLRHKQLPETKVSVLRTWKSPTSNITYPNSVMLTLGDYAEFLLIPNFVNGEMSTGPTDTDAFIEVGVRVILVKSSAEYEQDCPSESGDDPRTENIGVMEYQGFFFDAQPLKGLLEGGVYTSVSY